MARKTYTGKPMVERARKLRREQTEQEAALWEALRGHGFMGLKFRRQHQLGRYIADFYCAELRLVVELDGMQHSQPDAIARDQVRDALIQSLGLSVLRFPNQASHLEILEAVEKHAASRARGKA